MSTTHALPSEKVADESGDRILRYTFVERVNHWIAALSYTYCLWTGLAIWSPYLYWMAAFVGGGPTARSTHSWIGLIFFLSTIYMYVLWHDDMRITDHDRAWWKVVDRYIRNEDEDLPPIGRFNYGQKLFFWAMFYGAILLLLSGIVLWFPHWIPWNLRWLRYLSVAIHVAAALVTIGGFIIHVYMGTAMVRGGFTSIIRGEVSAAWARMHHRLWYEQVIRQKRPEK